MISAPRLAACLERVAEKAPAGSLLTTEHLLEVARRLREGDDAGRLPAEEDYEEPPLPIWI